MDGDLNRCSVDLVKNSQGELLVDCMKSCGLVFVNGRQGLDQFTCISARGRSVVDYCLVPGEELLSIQNFVVKTMSEYEEELYGCEEEYRIPDHSVLVWDILVDGVVPNASFVATEDEKTQRRKKFTVPEDYVCGQEEFIGTTLDRLERLGDSQSELDAVYVDLPERMKSGLKEVKCGDKNSEFQKKKCEQLERDLKCPKKFWKALKKMNVGKARKQGHDLLQVYDEGVVVRSGEEAIEIWRTHFARVLGGDDNEDTKLDNTHTREDVDLSECSQRLYEPISKEEVLWALNVVKKDAAPGLDGVVMEMMLTERLLEVWVALFRVCWERERVPTMWRESIVVPVPKKQVRGACDVNTFRGISLTSMVSKVLCKVLENRLSCVVGEKGLIADFFAISGSIIIAL